MIPQVAKEEFDQVIQAMSYPPLSKQEMVIAFLVYHGQTLADYIANSCELEDIPSVNYFNQVQSAVHVFDTIQLADSIQLEGE